jgi:para-aminobenzoate synthetase component 2
LLANWLTMCGDADAVERSAGLAPVVSRGPDSLDPAALAD